MTITDQLRRTLASAHAIIERQTEAITRQTETIAAATLLIHEQTTLLTDLTGRYQRSEAALAAIANRPQPVTES